MSQLPIRGATNMPRRHVGIFSLVLAAVAAVGLGADAFGADAEGTRVLSLEQVIARYADADSRFIDVDGVKLHVKDQGKGPAILLIHGSGGDLSDWDGWTRTLVAGGWRVVRLDLPGFGMSGPIANGNYSIDRLQSLVDGLMDERGIERFAIVGTSYGGPTAFRYAATRTGRITGLVIMNSAGHEYGKQEIDPKTGQKSFYAASMNPVVSREALAAGMRKGYNDPARLTEERIDRKLAYQNVVGRSEEATIAINQYVRGDPERVLAHVRAPVLVFWGGASQALSQSTADRFYDAVVNAKVREKAVQSGGGHLMHVEMPEPTSARVLAFLDKHVRAEAAR